jgi:hypothetical protein
MSYGIILWGDSFNSINIFRLQKKVIRIITNSRNKDYCRELFKKLRILPFYSQYIFSLLTFVINNCNFLISNSVICNINTRHNNNLDLPHVNLSMYQKGVYYSGIKVFNNLPTNITNLSCSKKQFRTVLKKLPFD